MEAFNKVVYGICGVLVAILLGIGVLGVLSSVDIDLNWEDNTPRADLVQVAEAPASQPVQMIDSRTVAPPPERLALEDAPPQGGNLVEVYLETYAEPGMRAVGQGCVPGEREDRGEYRQGRRVDQCRGNVRHFRGTDPTTGASLIRTCQLAPNGQILPETCVINPESRT